VRVDYVWGLTMSFVTTRPILRNVERTTALWMEESRVPGRAGPETASVEQWTRCHGSYTH